MRFKGKEEREKGNGCGHEIGEKALVEICEVLTNRSEPPCPNGCMKRHTMIRWTAL